MRSPGTCSPQEKAQVTLWEWLAILASQSSERAWPCAYLDFRFLDFWTLRKSLPGFFVCFSAVGLRCCIAATPPVSASIFRCMCPLPNLLLLIRTPIIRLELTINQYDLLLTWLYLRGPYFQTRSHFSGTGNLGHISKGRDSTYGAG